MIADLTKCPHCDVDLNVELDKKHMTCNACGRSIVVREEKKSEKEDLIRIWMKLGLSASKARNQQDAYEYFSKVVEMDPDNWMAIFLKGRSAAAQSTIANPKINLLLQAIDEADQIIKNQKLNEKELIEARNLFATTFTHLIDALSILHSKRFERVGTLFLDLHWNLMWETRLWHENAIEYYQFAIGLIENFQDEKSTANRVALKKKIASQCISICDFQLYYRDYERKHPESFGYRVTEKQLYIDLYDQMITDIRVYEPNFGMLENYYIDRLDPPPANFASGYLESRTKVLKKLEKHIDQHRNEQAAKLREQPLLSEESYEERSFVIRKNIHEKIKVSKIDYSVFQDA